MGGCFPLTPTLSIRERETHCQSLDILECFGFAEAERVVFDAKLAGSPEWNLPRCSSAAFLRLELAGKMYGDG